jgi:hypothetical protein
MANIVVAPGTWVEVFDANTDGSFRIVRCKAKLLRKSSVPLDSSEGLTIECSEDSPSETFTYVSDGVNALYVYNKSESTGLVERDI